MKQARKDMLLCRRSTKKTVSSLAPRIFLDTSGADFEPRILCVRVSLIFLAAPENKSSGKGNEKRQCASPP